MIPRSAEICVDPQRRAEVRAKGRNGIDYLEVGDDQRSLTVFFLRDAPQNLEKENVLIEGGGRVQGIKVVEVRLCSADDPEQDDCMQVFVDQSGDFSTYTLRLVEIDHQGNPTGTPLSGFDPRYAQLDFSFKAGLASDLDCQLEQTCPPPQLETADINYLAKDYASFRQLILDRLALIMPDWQETHVPDEGIALVEVLAYVADYLSYYQDAVATEAYLNTGRRRISVRRHARLLDYAVHEGCNARVWIVVNPSQDVTVPPLNDPSNIYFVAGYEGPVPAEKVLSPDDLRRSPAGSYLVFAPVTADPLRLFTAHYEIPFYTWGNRQCCLPMGATSATLQDSWKPLSAQQKQQSTTPGARRRKKSSPSNPDAGDEYDSEAKPAAPRERTLQLQPGDVLLFEEVIGPETGSADDADHHHRQFVRLTKVEAQIDPLNDQPVVEIEWAADDALTFQLCLSTIGPAPPCAYISGISVARGNVILADHGSWIRNEWLGMVPRESLPQQLCESANHPAHVQVTADKFNPALKNGPLTFRQPPGAPNAAAGALIQDPRSALPQILLSSIAPLPDGSGPVFSFADLENPAECAARVADPQDDASRVLREQLSRETLALLNDPAKLAEALKKEFVRQWTPQPDLLSSQAGDYHFVVEVDDSGVAYLRFGNGDLGRAVEAGETFAADYRVGNGTVGNIGAEAIQNVVFNGNVPAGITLVPTNALPARGGIAPESADEVKLFAPGTFLKKLERAITADDYAALAESNPKVQRAASTLLWTGTRYEAHVAIDPLGTETVASRLLEEIREYLYPFRRIGHDLVVVPAQYVPLDLAMTVNLRPDYLKAHVKAALLDVFSDHVLAGGGRGFFHPDNLSFGDSIYVSQLVAAAQAVTGVESVSVTKLERLFAGPNHEIENGLLPTGPLEVAQLDNDPVFPERGRLVLTMRGGR